MRFSAGNMDGKVRQSTALKKTKVKVLAIEGVKLIVEPVTD